jgi:hypothetical protein
LSGTINLPVPPSFTGVLEAFHASIDVIPLAFGQSTNDVVLDRNAEPLEFLKVKVNARLVE